LLESFGVDILPNELPWSKDYQSTNPKVFLAGDMRKGQSLVVWAISEGREAAYHLDKFLQGKSHLPQKDHSFYEHAGEVERKEGA
jgi:glutamate synthase (NADPH) small chain